MWRILKNPFGKLLMRLVYILAGWLVAKGYMDESLAVEIAGFLTAAIAGIFDINHEINNKEDETKKLGKS